jgi:hypothetical protein
VQRHQREHDARVGRGEADEIRGASELVAQRRGGVAERRLVNDELAD